MVLQQPNVSPESLPWAKELTGRVRDLDADARRFQLDALNTNKQLNSSITLLAEQVRALPFQVTDVATATGFSLSATYVNKVVTTITVPDGKNYVNVLAIGYAQALDMTTGGATVAYGRIVINNVASTDFSAAKDAGASVVNNILYPTYGREFGISPGGTVTVTIQIRGLNGSAFTAQASNLAQLSVVATFTSV